MKTTHISLKILATIVLIGISSVSYGQIVPPPIPPPPPPGLPIDGGILFLLLSGLYFGVSKLKK